MIKKGKRFDSKFNPEIKDDQIPILIKLGLFFKNISSFVLGAGILIIASQGIVKSSLFFAESFKMPLVIIGVLIVSLGTALPEVYFSAYAAKKGEGEMMAGNLLGATAMSTSLVLGVVSIISPINDIQLFSYFMSRFTLFIAVLLFIFFMLSEHKISKKESLVLLSVYVVFLCLEILF